MFSLKEKFQFLEDGIDFPFYNDIPKLSVAEWLFVLAGLILMIALIMGLPIPKQLFDLAICLVVLIPALYICKGNYGLLFKVPKLKDFLTIILCLIGYLIYEFIISGILFFVFKYPISGNSAMETMNFNFISAVGMLIHLMGEELFKILWLLLLMHAVYKLTNNRSLSIGLALAGTLFIFGMAHYYVYGGMVLQILLIQGLGSIFDVYAYMKTKNVIVSYILHIIIDWVPFVLMGLNLVHPIS